MAKVEPRVAITAKFEPGRAPQAFPRGRGVGALDDGVADGGKALCHATYAENLSHFRAKATRAGRSSASRRFYYDEPSLITRAGG